jgi:protease PrsW
MLFQFTAVSAIVPTLLIIWYFYSRDVYREPARVIWAVFGLGVASVVPVLAIAIPISWLVGDAISNPYLVGLFEAFCEAAIPEELCKFLVVYLYASRHKEFDEPMDGILYGVVASLGFATLENIMYTMGGGLSVALMRAVTAVPLHAFCGAVMGYYVGQAKFGALGKSRGGLLFKAWFWPMLMHGLYDFPLLAVKTANEKGGLSGDAALPMMALLLLTLATLIVLWIWAVKLTRRLRQEQLAGMTAAAQQGFAVQSSFPQLPGLPQQPGHPQQPGFPQQPGLPRQPGFPHQPAVGQAPHAPTPYGQSPYPHHYAQPPAYWRPPPPPAGKSSVGGWIMLIFGGLVASGGGLMMLGLMLAFATGQVEKDQVAQVVLGGAMVGLLPLVAGLFLFGFGIKKIRDAAGP